MDLDRFIREKSSNWDRLEQLLDVANRSPEWELGHKRIEQIITLYRQVCSDLNYAKNITSNPELIGRLNILASRAYRFVYRGTKRESFFNNIWKFITHDAPTAFRAERASVIYSAIALLLGALLGMSAVLMDMSNADVLVPSYFNYERPKDRVARIEKNEERIQGMDDATAFSVFLFTHNIKVSFLAFSLGALTIVFCCWIIFINGIALGAIATAYYLDGVGWFFIAWVGPHGALELPAIVFSGAAGLKLGRALLMPGDFTRAVSIRKAMPTVWKMLVTSMGILVMAGIIEGSFSQFSEKTISYNYKVFVAGTLFVALIGYLFFMKIRPAKQGD